MPKQASDLWEKVCVEASKMPGRSEGSGNRKWVCKFCNLSSTGTLSKLEAHIGGKNNEGVRICPLCPPEIRNEVRKKRGWDANESTATMHAPSMNESEGSPSITPGQAITGATLDASTSAKRPRGPLGSEITPIVKQTTLTGKGRAAKLQKAWMKTAESEIGKCLIECNLPFALLDTPSWKQMIEAVALIGAKYVGPSSSTMKRRIIPNAYHHIQNEMKTIENLWVTYGCTLMTDGWVDIKKRGLYNVMISSAFGTVYRRSYDMSGPGIRVTGQLLFEKMKEQIDQIGAANIVQVITDNGSNCVLMGSLVEEHYPTIVWTPCASHSLNLLLKDIANLEWVKSSIEIADVIVRFFAKKKSALAIYRKYAKKELIKPTKTRYGSTFIMLERIVEVWDNIRQVVVSPEWLAWPEKFSSEAMNVQRLCLDYANFTSFDDIIKIIRPIYSVLRLTDREGSTIGLLYEFMSRVSKTLDSLMRQEISSSTTSDRIASIRALLQARWDWFHRPIHAVAYLLHPLWRDGSASIEHYLHNGWVAYLMRIYGAEKSDQLYDELLQFRRRSGSFCNSMADSKAAMEKPVTWWEKYGGSTPALQKLAIRVLSQDCSSGAVERNWSAHSLIHTKRRNKLKILSMHRLIYCRENLRALRKYKMLRDPKQINPNDIDVTKVPEPRPVDRTEEDLYRRLFDECSGAYRVTRSGSRRRAGAHGNDSIQAPLIDTRAHGGQRGGRRQHGRGYRAGRLTRVQEFQVENIFEEDEEEELDEEEWHDSSSHSSESEDEEELDDPIDQGSEEENETASC